MKKLWKHYPSTIVSLALLSLALVYGWYDSRVQRPVLGVSTDETLETARVALVIDGNTIQLEDGRVVRYLGVRTPEGNPARNSFECFAREAMEKNKELVEGKVVYLETGAIDTDRYGRLFRYVWLEDSLVNHELVLGGFGAAISTAAESRYTDELVAAERAARVTNRGMWAACR